MITFFFLKQRNTILLIGLHLVPGMAYVIALASLSRPLKTKMQLRDVQRNHEVLDPENVAMSENVRL